MGKRSRAVISQGQHLTSTLQILISFLLVSPSVIFPLADHNVVPAVVAHILHYYIKHKDVMISKYDFI